MNWLLKDTINSWPVPVGTATLPPGVSDNNGVMVLAVGTQMGVYQKLTTRAGGELVSSRNGRAAPRLTSATTASGSSRATRSPCHATLSSPWR